ncbi:MAG: bifunctional folylpolyglutamate synthase/dihydrofolate synthase [Paludibacter sp.]|nr:bifunctional folylpolyglutamate synthase/dihydrofolate synthase [Paludibacter sp.]
MTSYSQTIKYLYDRLPVFHQVGSSAYKPGLDNTIQLMNALDNPHTKYKTIHIAGTNGKGSVSHFLSAILQEAGYKVGLYTSPHLVDFGERIRVNGQMIDQQYVVDFVEQHKPLFSNIEPSFFEATMAMAFQYFADKKVDVAIIEVGLGGRLDSTNIINPVLSVITNISFDHVGFLGDSLAKIAFEKAGIIKSNTPVIIGEFLLETRPVFELKAQEMNAPISFAEEIEKADFQGYEEGKMIVKINNGKKLTIGLNGIYQLKNISTVLTVVQQLSRLNFIISEQQLYLGLKNVVEITGLQGRWQFLQNHPTIIADTGHNVAGISYVVEQLEQQTFKTLRIIIGMVNDKDISSVLKLLPLHAVYYFTQANIERALPAIELQEMARTFDLIGDAYITVKQAVNKAISESDTDDFVFIGGSNFVVGEALGN